MNSILKNSQQKDNQFKSKTPLNFKEFAKNWTPQSAKAEVERMISTGQISQSQYQMAEMIANQLIKK